MGRHCPANGVSTSVRIRTAISLPQYPAVDTVTFLALPTGSYTINETSLAGYHFAVRQRHQLHVQRQHRHSHGDFSHDSSQRDLRLPQHAKRQPDARDYPLGGGAIGTVLNDTATLAGASSPTGSITFNLYGPGDTTCAGPVLYTQVVALSGASATTSPGFTTLAAGVHRWTASYPGDATNNPASSGCDAELVTINKSSPTLGTTPSGAAPSARF